MAVKKSLRARKAGEAGKAGKAGKGRTNRSNRRAKPFIELDEASATTQARVLRGFRRVLKENGISGDIAAFQLDAKALATGRLALDALPARFAGWSPPGSPTARWR